jgi:hypothetical protein
MRRTLLSLAFSMVLAAFAGCACNDCCNPCGCHVCPGGCCNRQGPQDGQQQAGAGGVVSWPYYTVRGPRDFLETNPQSIGP